MSYPMCSCWLSGAPWYLFQCGSAALQGSDLLGSDERVSDELVSERLVSELSQHRSATREHHDTRCYKTATHQSAPSDGLLEYV